jgi:hypothetical protein
MAKSGGIRIPPLQFKYTIAVLFCDNLAKDKIISAFFIKLPRIIFGFF